MKISFLVTVHNESHDLRRLLNHLETYLDFTGRLDEVVVLDDYSTNQDTVDILNDISKLDCFTVIQHKLDVKGDGFGGHKQFGNEHCNGDYIFQIDADEYFSETLLYNMRALIESNSNVDLFLVPRVNIIRGLTQSNYRRYGWQISKLDEFKHTATYNDRDAEGIFLRDNGFVISENRISDTQMEMTYHHPIINWASGDYQFRLYVNEPTVRWDRPLHEHIVGAKVQTHLPKVSDWSLIHDKTMERQIEQNEFYMTEFSKDMNIRR